MQDNFGALFGDITEVLGGQEDVIDNIWDTDFQREKSKKHSSGKENGTPVNQTDKLDIDSTTNDPYKTLRTSKLRMWLYTIFVVFSIYLHYICHSVTCEFLNKIEDELPPLFNRPNFKNLGLSLSIYNLGIALGSILFFPFSKLVGRFLALRISYGAFIIINAACGFTHTQKQMMILRTFAGIFVAAPVSLGPIILGELWGAKYRGRPLALNSLAIVVGPAIGRVLGQALLDKINWRWIFWLTSMLFTVLGVSIIISGPKNRAVEEKENSVKSSSRDIILSPNFSKSKTPKGFGILKTISLYSTRRALIPCPLRIMFSDPLVFMLSVHMGLIYTLYYMTSEYAPDVYKEVFKQSPLLSSLHMCSMGIGSIFASKLNTDTLSKFCDTLRIKNSSLQKLPEYKFRCMFPGVIFLPLGTGLFSFSTQGSNLWIVADLGLFFFGAGIVLSFRKATTYIIDTFGSQAAAALSAINILRRFAAFFIPIFVILTKPHLKCKWAEFSGAIVSLTLICPMPIVFFLKGKNIRRFPIQAL